MAKGYSVKIDHKGQRQKLQRAWVEANIELEENLAYEISQPLWDWPRATVRSDGSVAGSPRDAVDSGELLRSYSRRQEGPGRFVHAWSAPWALIVHNGMVTRSGTTVPPRPFTERPVQALPELFARKYRNGS